MYYIIDYYTDDIITLTDDLGHAKRLCDMYEGSQVENENGEIFWTNLPETVYNDQKQEGKTMTTNEIIENNLYSVAVQLMDDDIRESVHADLAPCSDLEFLTEYMRRHEEKYGERFTV